MTNDSNTCCPTGGKVDARASSQAVMNTQDGRDLD